MLKRDKQRRRRALQASTIAFFPCLRLPGLFVCGNKHTFSHICYNWLDVFGIHGNKHNFLHICYNWLDVFGIHLRFLVPSLLCSGRMAQLVEDSLIWSQLLIVTIWKIYVVTQLCCWDLNDGWSPNKKVTNEVRNSHQASSPSVKSSPPSTLTWWLRESRVNVLSTPKENSHELRQEERGEVQTVIIFMRASI